MLIGDGEPATVGEELAEAREHRAFGKGLLVGFAVGSLVFGGLGLLVGAAVEDALHPFGELYDKIPSCPSNGAADLEYEVDPSEGARYVRVLSWRNWTKIQVLDLGHRTPGGPDVSENHRSPLLTVRASCPPPAVAELVGNHLVHPVEGRRVASRLGPAFPGRTRRRPPGRPAED